MRTMTMRHSALLAWRSPPRSRRCRLLLPDEAGMGATPHRWAHAASEYRRSGLSPALINRAAAVSGPTPKRASSSGATASTSFSIRSSSSATSSSSPWIRWASEHSDALWAAITRSPERDGRSLAASAVSAATVMPLRRHRNWSGAVITRWRIWVSAQGALGSSHRPDRWSPQHQASAVDNVRGRCSSR